MTLPTILGSFEDHLSSIPEMTEASLPHSKFMPPPKKNWSNSSFKFQCFSETFQSLVEESNSLCDF